MESRQAKAGGERDPLRDADARLEALARRAEAALVFERAWPPLAWSGALVAFFLAISWLGLWLDLPVAARLVGVGLFAALLAAALAPLAWLRRPTRPETLARLDREARLPHHPAASLADRLAAPGDDPATQALWTLHRRRLARQIEALPPVTPSPRMAWRDPRALRFGALILALGAAIVAGPERYARVAAAFDWRGGAAAATARLDAWIDPPTYTGKPPILIDVAAARDAAPRLVAPEGSILVVRAEARDIETRVEGALTPLAGGKSAAPGSGPAERRWTIRGDGAFTLVRQGSPLARFTIAAIAAGAPTITLLEAPRANLSSSLTLHYALADRYGVANAQAEFAKPSAPGASPPPRALIEAPKLPLQLPGANGVGEAKTTSDLSAHPWAGAEVAMSLKAVSLSGATGAAAPVTITLPQRIFHNPIARALVEQRRGLILDPDHDRDRVGKALAALMIAPKIFATPSGVYLGLRTARSQLSEARGDADLVAVADLLWAMALRIEDGDASPAQRDLRAAEEKLREALKRGADDAEIRALTEQLRAAAERYMRDLAQKDARAEPELQPMEQRDLENLLDRFENTARNGARQDAEAMLDQLQDMFENMRSARDAQSSPAAREMRKQFGELQKLMRDQQALRDETFRRDQRDRRRREGAQDGQPTPQANGDEQDSGPSLEERQRELRDRLAEMQRRLKSLGMKGEKGFDDAEGDMKEAEGDLKAGDQGRGQGDGEAQAGAAARTGKGRAVEAQGRALEALREGAQGLQRQARNGGAGGYAVGGARPGSYGEGLDPLGRERGDGHGTLEGALNGGADVAERARRVLEELRRRLSDPNRPEEERDYLERLLKRD